MSYYIRDKEDYFIIVNDDEKFISSHKTRLSAGNSLFKRMVKDKLRKKKKVVDSLSNKKE